MKFPLSYRSKPVALSFFLIREGEINKAYLEKLQDLANGSIVKLFKSLKLTRLVSFERNLQSDANIWECFIGFENEFEKRQEVKAIESTENPRKNYSLSNMDCISHIRNIFTWLNPSILLLIHLINIKRSRYFRNFKIIFKCKKG